MRHLCVFFVYVTIMGLVCMRCGMYVVCIRYVYGMYMVGIWYVVYDIVGI